MANYQQKAAALAFSAKASNPIESADIFRAYGFNLPIISAARVKLCQTCGRFLPLAKFCRRSRNSEARYPRCKTCHALYIRSRSSGDCGETARTALKLVKAQRFDRFWRELARLRGEILTPSQLAKYVAATDDVGRQLAEGRDRLAIWKHEASAFGVELPEPKQRRRSTRKHRRRS